MCNENKSGNFCHNINIHKLHAQNLAWEKKIMFFLKVHSRVLAQGYNTWECSLKVKKSIKLFVIMLMCTYSMCSYSDAKTSEFFGQAKNHVFFL